MPGQEKSGIAIQESRIVPVDIDFPLAVDFEIDPADNNRVKLGFQYNAQQFSPRQITQLGLYYQGAIEALLRDPHASFLGESLMTEEERNMHPQVKVGQAQERPLEARDGSAVTRREREAVGGQNAVGRQIKVAEQVQGIWQEVLGVREVGMDQDFLALGGHSLLATQIVARLRQETGWNVPLSMFCRCRTVSEFVDELQQTAMAGGA